jgi:pteridine reductase
MSHFTQVVLITGAAKRVGAEVARHLHARGMNLVLHYRASKTEAEKLKHELELRRADSVALVQADLLDSDALPDLVNQATEFWDGLTVLINNASSFYPTPVGEITEQHWQDLLGSNLKAPLFLSQAAAPFLRRQRGCIINMVDIHAARPMAQHTVYNIAKAGLAMLTQSLAWELGPDVRVNGVAPGAVLWPDGEKLDDEKQSILARTALKRPGSPQDIAQTIGFLVCDAPYITGQIISVDGGRSLHM